MVSPLSEGCAARRRPRAMRWSRPSAPFWWSVLVVRFGGQSRDRSDDLTLFRRALYQLSYLTKTPAPSRGLGAGSADLTGFEPAASGLTGRRALLAAPQVRTADETLAPQTPTHSRLRVRPTLDPGRVAARRTCFFAQSRVACRAAERDGSATVKMLGDGGRNS